MMLLDSLFIDFNAYFASAEQHLRPELRGLPVGIAPLYTDATCCIAVSYEARAFGVRTGTMVYEAKKLCPHINIVEARPSLYVKLHHKLVAVVDSCIPVDEVVSIDEMACSLTSRWRDPGKAAAIALEIKQAIARRVGPCMRSSIGIGPNRFLAKTGTNMQKPDGLVIIQEKDLPHCLYGLDLKDITGIGRNMLKRLQTSGIHTVKELCAARKKELHGVWGGIEGDRMYARLRGEFVPCPPTRRSSIGHSHILPPRLRNQSGALAVLHRLLQKAAMRLRHLGYFASCLSAKIKYVGGGRWKDSVNFLETQNTFDLVRGLSLILQRRKPVVDAPLAVSVTLTGLLAAHNTTPPLFDRKKADRQAALFRTVDAINRDYGGRTVYCGSAHRAMHAAPMRIAFTHIPDLKTERD